MDMEIVDLYYRYGSQEILKGINLKIGQGEIFALVGPTGAGKTTLLRLIDLLDKPTAGTIKFAGKDSLASPRFKLKVRRKMSMVFQKPLLFNTTVYENVAYPLRVRGYKERDIANKVIQVLHLVSMDSYVKSHSRKLSGGETQRVALARAIVSEPEMLLLDEPTANLDPLSVDLIESLILRLSREQKTTVVMATHNMLQGQHLADRIGVLMKGELVQAGKSTEVFRAPENEEVAKFVGVENILKGVVISNDAGMTCIDVQGHTIEGISNCRVGEKVHVCIRAENITLSTAKHASSARNFLSGQVKLVAFSGPLVRVELACPFPLIAVVTKKSAEDMQLGIGKKVYASFKATALHIIG
ncbi:ABC transporter ATP-binding protein [Candidatus Aerophobetes bacterium]|nr:ABC transporter ATP-binding protein [Candidatus Aerophobetes bacterium]